MLRKLRRALSGAQPPSQDVADALDRSWSGRHAGPRPTAQMPGSTDSRQNEHRQPPPHVQVGERGLQPPGATPHASSGPDGTPPAPPAHDGGGRAEATLEAVDSAVGAASLPPTVDSAAPPRELRPSSLPQPLRPGAQAQAAGGSSGPGAPVSPDPTIVLRRAPSTVPSSSQPALSQDSTNTSLISSLAAYEAGGGGGAAARHADLPSTAAPSTEGSRRSGELSRHSLLSRLSSMSGASTASGSTAGSSAAPRRKLRKRASSPPPSMMWHPALVPVPEARKSTGSVRSARSTRSSQRDASPPEVGPAPAPASQPTASPLAQASLAGASPRLDDEAGLPAGLPIPPAAEPGGYSPLLPDTGCGTPASAATTVSLLSLQLRGPSAAGSAAASREASSRGGRRQPMGGLSLALSRESSVRDGSIRGTRESSVRAGGREDSYGAPASGSRHHRSGALREAIQAGPGGQRSYRGLAVVGADEVGGCGSGEWMGVPTGARMVDPVAALARALADPVAPADPDIEPLAAAVEEQEAAARAAARQPSAPPSLPPSLPPAAAEAAADPAQPGEPVAEGQQQEEQLVGSWAQRVTKFAAPPPAAAPRPGGLDVAALSAALAELAAAPAGQSPGSPGVLVGDSELAMRGGATQPDEQRAVAAVWVASAPAGSSGGSAAAAAAEAAAAAALCSSLDAARDAAAAVLGPPVLLGGSVPARRSRAGTARGSAADLAALHAPQRLALDVGADSREWSRSFQKRWRAVRKRAYLQALGLRALWRVSSVSDRHEPLELLTNDLPSCDNGMRRAWSASRLPEERRASAAVPTGGSRAAADMLRKDPSLAALLLGEVAEVC